MLPSPPPRVALRRPRGRRGAGHIVSAARLQLVYSSVLWSGDRKGIEPVAVLHWQSQRFFFGAPCLTWSDLWKNRSAKCEPNIVLAAATGVKTE